MIKTIKIKMSYFVFLISFIFSQLAFGAAGWDDHATKTAIYQLINVTILFGAVIYFMKDSVKEFFIKRNQDYKEAADLARTKLEKVQAEFSEIQSQLTRLETTWTESLARAQAEASDLKKQMLADTEVLSKRLLDEAQRGFDVEANRLNQKILLEVVESSKNRVIQDIKTRLSQEDHKRLQTRFHESVQRESV